MEEPVEDASSWASLTVENTEGADVPIGSLWADRPAVIAFVRHFG